MSLDLPIPLRFARRPSASTFLSLWAAASGDPAAWQQMCEIFGRDALPDELATQARSIFAESRSGYLVDRYVLNDVIPDTEILFDGDDNGHKRSHPGLPLVFKRSVLECDANTVAYPAFPHKPTLDLACGPAPITNRPVVTFCGRADRPAARVQLLQAFEHAPGLCVRIVRFSSFCGGNAQDYLDEIRASHFVLCPPGMGHYSYRFYEALAAGRVPVIPSSGHAVAPASLESEATIIRADGPKDVAAAWETLRPDWDEVHKRNRRAWMTYASPLGWLWHCANEIRSRL